jgi:uncharacterized membrane protein YqiK
MQRHDDIARKLIQELEAENARLKAEVERLQHLANQSEFYRSQLQKDTCRLENIQMQDAFKHYEAENARLKAEVERLRKAGDAMAFNYKQMSDFNGIYDTDFMKYVDRWNAAKEGKPSV